MLKLQFSTRRRLFIKVARPAQSRKNLFGFGSSKKDCATKSSLAFGSAKRQAYAAGSASGANKPKSKSFDAWLCSKGLQDRPRDQRKQLEEEYRKGVKAGGVDTFRASDKIKEIAEDQGYQDAKNDRDRNLSADEILEYISGQSESSAWIDKMGKGRIKSIYTHAWREGKRRYQKESKKETKQQEKSDLVSVVKEVRDALVENGVPKAKAQNLARTKYSKGDSFSDLWHKVESKIPIQNPASRNSAGSLKAAGYRLVDRYSNRDTATEVARRYAPYRLIYQGPAGTAAKWEVWTKQSLNPKGGKFDRCVKDVSKRGGAASPYAVCEKSVGRKNPSRKNPLDKAEKLYEEFTGLPATEVLEFKEEEHFHKFTSIYGKLVCLDILTVDGREIPLIAPGFQFEPARFLRRDIRHSREAESAGATWTLKPGTSKDQIVYVTFTEDGRQMIFRGGDQTIPYDDLGFKPADVRDHMFIGTIVQITYRGKKKFELDGKEEVDFHHPFGEQGSRGILPVLGYLLRTKRMMSFGGRYKTAPVRANIGASPGIVG